MVDCYVHSEERRSILLNVIEQTKVKGLLSEYYSLPLGLTINLIDKSSINYKAKDFHSLTQTSCWVLIDDGAKNLYPDIYKKAIHHVKWDDLIQFCEKELLIVLEKCVVITNQFKLKSKDEFVQIQKIDESFKVLRTKNIYLFTTIEKNTFMYYQSNEGVLKKDIVRNSLTFLENKLSNYSFFRTHKNYLVNVSQLSKNLDLSSTEIVISKNISAKLSKGKQDDLIKFLESL